MVTQTGITPLVASNIAWTNFIKDVAELTGHSPTQNIDKSNCKLSDYGKYIIALSEFQSNKDIEPLQVLKSSEHLLDHLFFSFLVFGSNNLIFRIMELTYLNVISAKTKEKGRLAVVSGTLRQWKSAIIICSRLKAPWINIPKDVRWVFNNCLDYFNQFGLGNIFDNYRRIQLKDGTLLLEKK